MKRNEQIALVKLLAQSLVEDCEKYESANAEGQWGAGKFPYHPVLGLTVLRQKITRLRTELNTLSKMLDRKFDSKGGE